MPIETIKKIKNSLHYQFIRKTNYLKWLARTIGKKKEGFVVKKIQGSLMYLSTKDRGISYDLIIDGIREPKRICLTFKPFASKSSSPTRDFSTCSRFR